MKISSLKIHDPAGWTMVVFGVLAVLLGIVGLVRPEILLTMLGFETIERAQRASSDYTIVFMTASSMASFNMGVYYIFAALNNVKVFYRWTVPFRSLTFLVFTSLIVFGVAPLKFLGVGLWELIGAIATGIALYLEPREKRALTESQP